MSAHTHTHTHRDDNVMDHPRTQAGTHCTIFNKETQYGLKFLCRVNNHLVSLTVGRNREGRRGEERGGTLKPTTTTSTTAVIM